MSQARAHESRMNPNYDDRGRVYQAIRYAVDPATGIVGNGLVDNTWYDASGNVIESRPAGSDSFTQTVYDGIGRATVRYVGYPTAPDDHVTPLNLAVIFEQSETTYDAASNVLMQTSRQRFHDATGTGPLQGPSGSQPKSRDSYVANWYDGIGRTIASANYGTNDNMGPPVRPASPPEE